MPLAKPIQHSFMGGELSPLMDMRHDIKGRAQSANIMENFFAHLQGPAQTRGGFERVLGVVGASGRIFTFQITAFAGFIVTVTPTKIHISDGDGFISHDDLMTNGDFLQGGASWTLVTNGSGTVTFVEGAAFLNPGAGITQYAGIEGFFPATPGTPYQVTIQIQSGEGPLHVMLGSLSGQSDLYDAVHSGTTTIVIDVIATGTNIFVRPVAEGGDLTKVLDKITAFDNTVAPEAIEFDSPWPSTSVIQFIQAEMAPKELTLYFMSGAIVPYTLSYDPVTRDWDFEPMTFIGQPPEWVNGSWPAALTFFEGRLYLAGTINDAEDFWGSRPLIYNDFTLGQDPDHAIHYSVSKKGIIRWLEGSSTLVIGTDSGEYIASSQAGLLIPGDISIKQQSANGSQALPARLVGNNILYVSSDSRKIRSMSFEWTKEAWLSKDLTFGAEHMTEGGNFITHLEFAQNPHNIIWAVTALGTLIGGSYLAEQQLAAFHRHYTDGRFNSICIKRFGGSDELWALVDRDDEGELLSLEKYSFNAQVDSFTQFHFEVPSVVLTGLDHLALKMCNCMVDGAVHPQVLVQVDGTAILERAGTDVFIGLPFIGRLLTAPRDDQQPTEGRRMGSARSADKRWAAVYVRIMGSWKPKVNGVRMSERTAAAPMNAIQPAATEDIQVTLRGWDKEALVDITQDLPVPTTVLGLFGDLAQEG